MRDNDDNEALWAARCPGPSPAVEVCPDCHHDDGVDENGRCMGKVLTGRCHHRCVFPPAPASMSWTEYDRSLEPAAPAPAARPASPPELTMGHARIRAANGETHDVVFECSACKRRLIWSFENWKCPCGNGSFRITMAVRVPTSRPADYAALSDEDAAAAREYDQRRWEVASRPVGEQARLAAEKAAKEIYSRFVSVTPDASWSSETVPQAIAAIISRHVAESDLFRAGVAACVGKVKEIARFNHEYGQQVDASGQHEHAAERFAAEAILLAVASDLESLTDSAPPLAAAQLTICGKRCDNCEPPPCRCLKESSHSKLLGDGSPCDFICTRERDAEGLASDVAAQQEVNSGEDAEPLASWRELAISYHLQDSHALRFNDCMTEPCSSARNAINHVTGLLTRAHISGVAEEDR